MNGSVHRKVHRRRSTPLASTSDDSAAPSPKERSPQGRRLRIGTDPAVETLRLGDEGSELTTAAMEASEESTRDHPTVFVVGCDGCASNALAALMELQPGAAMGSPLQGEEWWAGENPAFFSQEDHYVRGVDWYLQHYTNVATRPNPGGSGTNASRLLIDATKGYLSAP